MAGVTVVPAGQEPTPEPEAADGTVEVALEPAGPRSPLALLKGKRADLERKLHHDMAVPRWEAELGRRIWVRYGPANPAVFTQSAQKREKAHAAALSKGGRGDPDWLTKANADMLVDACEAVYDLALDEKPPEGDLPPGDYPTFGSPELADALTAQHNAVATVLALYGTSGDVLIAASQLSNWSSQASEEVDGDFLGS